MPEVCILGGGYAGLRVARELPGRLDRSWSITLVDRSDCHQLLTRLPEVVAAKIPTRQACIPFDQLLSRRVTHLYTEVLEIDVGRREVTTSAGTLRPDVLVISLGTTPDFLDIPGAAANTTTLKSVHDAERIRDVIAGLRSRQPVVRVVIIGAGYTGSEVAGELTAHEPNERTERILGKVDVRIVAEDPRLLPQASPELSASVEHVLRRRNIPLNLGQSVERVDADGLTTEDGKRFPADLVIWAGQTHVGFHLHRSGGHDLLSGKLQVDPYLQVRSDGTVFACGDAASIFDFAHGTIAASSAQLALQEGSTVAGNIAALAQGKQLREYRPRVLGEALGLGGTGAVAQVGGVVLSGRAAAAVKRAALVRYLAGLSLPTAARTTGLQGAKGRSTGINS